MQPSLSDEKIRAVQELLKQKVSLEDIHRRAGVSTGSVSRISRGLIQCRGPLVEVPPSEPMAFDALRKALHGGQKTVVDLADAMDCSPKKVQELLGAMAAKGGMLFEVDGRWGIKDSINLEPGRGEIKAKAGVRRFGVIGDNHLCNKHSRLDVLNAAYDHYEREGITEVFNTGNWIDGEAKFNRTELIVRPGMDAQLEYLIENYPQRKGITTRYIAGDDHEGWYQQREGIEIGRRLQQSAEDAGRTDLKYLGYGECDVKLVVPGGSACMRVVHPGGGSAYAISYTDQKRVESYQGGEKPQIELVGHYHKFNYGYPREVHTVQCGCTTDQSLFMRKKRLQAHVGFVVVNLDQATNGTITRFSVEWFPFFDRGYYERRF